MLSKASCPRCGYDGWKLAKVIHELGTSAFSTESHGGGLGAIAGVGDGQRGVAVSYQSAHLQTEGAVVSAVAKRLAPPEEPNEYESRSFWRTCIDVESTRAEAVLKEVNEFGRDPSARLPTNWLGAYASRDGDIEHHLGKAQDYRRKLLNARGYEIAYARWSVTRVCDRCGESYIAESDAIAAERSVAEVPPVAFSGEDKRCPDVGCRSYMWKTARLFMQIPLDQAAEALNLAKQQLLEAEQLAQRPPPKTVWGKVTRVFSRGNTVEMAEAAVDAADAKVQAAVAALRQAIEEHPDLDSLRACAVCGRFYGVQHPPPLRNSMLRR